MMTKITPLIICGGNGTRLWPISRKHSPKQFQRIGGEGTLTFFQTAVQRHRSSQFADPIIVTGRIHEGTVRKQLQELQVKARIICEPMGRNTGPAVLAAAEVVLADDPDAIFVVVPADHVIEGDLVTPLGACIPACQAGHIVTFGITPRYPESGFGYIVDKGPLGEDPFVRQVAQFVEKPAVEDATALIEAGNAYWASGISMFAAKTIRSEYRAFDPMTAAHVQQSVLEGTVEDGVLYLQSEPFEKAAAQPTESAVFERTERIAFAPLNVSWDDVGSWKAMYGISPADTDGNVLQGNVIAHEAQNTMVRADSRLVSVVGLSDIIVIDTADALLVARMDETQNVKAIVDELKRTGRPEAERHHEAKPAMVPMVDAKLVSQLAPSENYQVGAAEIGVGSTLTIEPGDARQALVVRGRVHATGAEWQKSVGEGGRIYADAKAPVVITNLSDEKSELLFVTLESADFQPKSIGQVVNG
ncbi:mannose-1-phosphate guanylyltransferase [Sulfitobacter aestuariivivens]|uniref:Mannose-1-phosphate guanylyltransferase/mannose-6-phosphate isomerase n=1 Tax=Sulfitobacter aestuariivivens TaxID=2766981 RepID=A0A927HIA3_9RHOB|nr:sugar phosphate nucleotidyltransferase [Sulfitobacter aestuariivivens]MBD3666055.1 mannose-1-phosphate guanylyltransferase/mannose-6-phosphate isomerase [Sulfitobacter aestuariivivens]